MHYSSFHNEELHLFAISLHLEPLSSLPGIDKLCRCEQSPCYAGDMDVFAPLHCGMVLLSSLLYSLLSLLS